MADQPKLSKSEKLFKKYQNKMSGFLTNNADATKMLNELAAGRNSYMRIDRVQSSSFDTVWLDTIEDVIIDLGDIIANPRMNTKIVTDIVPVELARKISAESVRHLASHTQFIKDIDENGDVIPNKILNIGHDDDLHTYENRFIATLIRKLVLFIEKRYEFITHFAQIYDEEVLYVKNESVVDGNLVEIETKVKVKAVKDDDFAMKSNSYLERIQKVREYILYFYSSPFMKKLKTEKDVRNPILQTNIIRKNVKYHHCYEVYKFIERYDSLGVTYKVDENYSLFNAEELQDLNDALLVSYLTLQSNAPAHNQKTNSKTYKPKILTSMDDESFVYGPLLEGPISFVRTDEAYRQYHLDKIKNDLPQHPTKREREYYLNEFSEKKEFKQDYIETDKMLKRIQKSCDEFEKNAQKIIEEREEENRKMEELLAQLRLEQEKMALDEVRQEVIETARKDFPQRYIDENGNVGVIQVLDEFKAYDDLYDENNVEEIPENFLDNRIYATNDPLEEEAQEEIVIHEAKEEYEGFGHKEDEQKERNVDDFFKNSKHFNDSADNKPKDPNDPYIGENGNWFINQQDTGIKAKSSENADSKGKKDAKSKDKDGSKVGVIPVVVPASEDKDEKKEDEKSDSEVFNEYLNKNFKQEQSREARKALGLLTPEEKAEEEAKDKAEAEAKAKAEAEQKEKDRLIAEAKAKQLEDKYAKEDEKRKAENDAVIAAEVDAKVKALEEARKAKEAEEKEKAKAEEEARIQAEVEVRLAAAIAEEKARREAEENSMKLAAGETELSDDEIDKLEDNGTDEDDSEITNEEIAQVEAAVAQAQDPNANPEDKGNFLRNLLSKLPKRGPYDYDDHSGVRYIVRQFHGFYVDGVRTTRKKYEAFVFKSNRAIKKFKKSNPGRVIKIADGNKK